MDPISKHDFEMIKISVSQASAYATMNICFDKLQKKINDERSFEILNLIIEQTEKIKYFNEKEFSLMKELLDKDILEEKGIEFYGK